MAERKRPHPAGPDEADYAVWETADLVELLRRKASPAVARQAARAGLEAVRAFETHLPALTRAYRERSDAYSE